jgi:hypothetical protein
MMQHVKVASSCDPFCLLNRMFDHCQTITRGIGIGQWCFILDILSVSFLLYVLHPFLLECTSLQINVVSLDGCWSGSRA